MKRLYLLLFSAVQIYDMKFSSIQKSENKNESFLVSKYENNCAEQSVSQYTLKPKKNSTEEVEYDTRDAVEFLNALIEVYHAVEFDKGLFFNWVPYYENNSSLRFWKSLNTLLSKGGNISTSDKKLYDRAKKEYSYTLELVQKKNKDINCRDNIFVNALNFLIEKVCIAREKKEITIVITLKEAEELNIRELDDANNFLIMEEIVKHEKNLETGMKHIQQIIKEKQGNLEKDLFSFKKYENVCDSSIAYIKETRDIDQSIKNRDNYLKQFFPFIKWESRP